MSKTKLSIAIVVASVNLIGCAEDSTNVPTSDIRLEVEATAGDRVSVILYERETTGRIELTAGDRLVASIDGGAEFDLPKSSVATLYETDLAANVQSLSLSMLRDSFDDATMSTAFAPDAVITSPSTFSRADSEIVITWSNTEPNARVTAFVDSCADIEIETIDTKQTNPDEGSVTLPMSEVLSEAGSTDADCAEISVLRILDAEVAPTLFSQTTMVARRFTTFQISLTP